MKLTPYSVYWNFSNNDQMGFYFGFDQWKLARGIEWLRNMGIYTEEQYDNESGIPPYMYGNKNIAPQTATGLMMLQTGLKLKYGFIPTDLYISRNILKAIKNMARVMYFG